MAYGDGTAVGDFDAEAADDRSGALDVVVRDGDVVRYAGNFASGDIDRRVAIALEAAVRKGREVLRYRRLRLASYPLLYVTIGICYGLLVPPAQDQDDGADLGASLITMFFCGAVIAELLALRRTRQLPPVRLRLADVVSRWGVGIYGTLVVVTFVFGLIDLQASPYITPSVLRLAEQNKGHLGLPIAVPFVATGLVLLLVAFVVWSAWTHSFSADIELDRALRTRSTRLILGLGIGMQLLLLALSWWRMEFLDYYGTGADLIRIGADSFGPDPTAVVIRDWARNMNDSIQPWTFLISIVALFSWIFVANPGARGRFRRPNV